MQPDINAFFDQLCSRYAWDFGALFANYGATAAGLVWPGNPPWYAQDFLAMHPKWGGVPTSLVIATTSGSPIITSNTTTGLQPGQLVMPVSGYIPDGTTILSIQSTTELTLSNPVAAANSALTISIITAPLIPVAVINLYVALASRCLAINRWCDEWQIAMMLFVDHFCTLWALSNGNVYSTAGQAAAAGLAQGIVTSESAGPVSNSLEPVPGLDGWAAWNQTQSGIQFATMAKVMGAGAIYVN